MFVDDAPFSADLVHQDGSVILRLTGELDVATGPDLLAAVSDLLSPHLTAVTLDLSALSFVDVAGARALLAVANGAADSEAEFCLRSPSPQALRVLGLVAFRALLAAVEPTSAQVEVRRERV